MKLKENKHIKDFAYVTESEYNSLISCNMLKYSYPFTSGVNYQEDMQTFEILSATIDALKLAAVEHHEWTENHQKRLDDIHSSFSYFYKPTKLERIKILNNLQPVATMEARTLARTAFALAEDSAPSQRSNIYIFAICKRLDITLESIN